jgi:hypothetical protein
VLAGERIVVQRLVDSAQHQRGGIRQFHPFQLRSDFFRFLPCGCAIFLRMNRLSASPPLLSLCSWAPPSTHSDKNAPHTAATALPDKIHRGFPPAPKHLSETNSRTPFSPRSFKRRRSAVQLALLRHRVVVLGSPEGPPKVFAGVFMLPALRENPRHSHQSPRAAIRSAPGRPSCSPLFNSQ